jgi:ABC-type Fe3+/spermidine/putrescine transport system ATPase subunit
LFVARFLGEANLFDVDRAGTLKTFGVRCEGASAGTAVLRPEDLGFAEHGFEGSGRVAARVEEVDFQGVRFRVVCSLPSAERVIVTVASDADPEPLRRGGELTLVCRNSAPHVIAAASKPESGDGADLDAIAVT